MNAKWIWLDSNRYPEYQKTYFGCEAEDKMPKDPKFPYNYCVADFSRRIVFDTKPERVELRVSGDTVFRFWVNGEFVGLGPVCAGGDFLGRKEPLAWYYANNYTLKPDGCELNIFAQVRLKPLMLTEFSHCQGGFYLAGRAIFADGKVTEFGTDESWRARRNGRYPEPCTYDGEACPDAWFPAVPTGDERALTDAPIKMLTIEPVYPQNPGQREIAIRSGEVVDVPFDMVYSANLGISCRGRCNLHIDFYEDGPVYNSAENIVLTDGDVYRSIRMHSAGGMRITVNSAGEGTVISPMLWFNHYPTDHEGCLTTSDRDINEIYRLCKWSLKICRQTIHLDSPKHQELLACTGDYYIETLMTLFTYGDLSLSREDVVRTGKWLCQNGGRMFHTTYSLIWVQMLKTVWQYTGDDSLPGECRKAMNLLFDLFETYVGESGVIENPPDYMFVDWMVTDGYTLHHPPRYLGQTVLNAFWYKALTDGAELAEYFGWEEGEKWRTRAAAVLPAFNRCFYDEARGMYFEGIDDEPGKNRRSFARYGNILAALYGLCDKERALRLVRMAADDDTDLKPIQPYFMNFLLQAVERYGLFDELGMKLIRKWAPSTRACVKGLQEGWYAPEEGYSFDHSHAWGGCPAYFIPRMLTGFTLLENGYKKIRLAPKCFDLDFAEVSFPTPYGEIRVIQRKGETPQITVPAGIDWELGDEK